MIKHFNIHLFLSLLAEFQVLLILSSTTKSSIGGDSSSGQLLVNEANIAKHLFLETLALHQLGLAGRLNHTVLPFFNFFLDLLKIVVLNNLTGILTYIRFLSLFGDVSLLLLNRQLGINSLLL